MANFYRKKNLQTGVDDFYNADNNSYISATQFGKGAGFTEVKAPTTPAVEQSINQSNNIDSSTLKVGMSSPDIASRLPDNTASSAALKVYTQNTQKDATKTSADLQSEIDRIKALQITDAQANVEKANKAVTDYNAGVQPAIDTYKENLTNQSNAISSVYTTDYYKSLLTDKKSITDEIVGYSKLIDEAVNTASGGATLASVASGRKNAVIADYGAKISVKQAALSAIDGNFSLASSILDTGISKLNDYYTNQINFQKLANEIFNTSEIKELTSKAITDLETKQKALETTKTAIQTLMSDPDTAVIAQKANILLTDTPEQVAQKLNNFYAKNPGYNTENIATNKSLITKYPDAGITLYDTPETVKTKLAQSKIYQNDISNKNNYLEFTNPSTGEVSYYNPATDAYISASDAVNNGIVSGYNISSYATDPNHEKSVQSILNSIGKLQTADDITNYIKKVAPNSPITAQMIQSTSQKFGVSWEMLIAMMQQDSSLGTAGKGARTYNPGNVGNDDSGNLRNYGNWQSGVDAVGSWLNNHRASNTTSQNNTAESWAEAVNKGTAKISDVPSWLKSAVISVLQNTTSSSQAQTSDTINHALDLIKELENDKSALKMATGLTSTLNKVPGTKAYGIAKTHSSLIDSLAITNLEKLKGPMSDKDIQFIRNATSKLDLGMSYNDYTKELVNLKKYLADKLNTVQTSSDPLNLGVNNDPLGIL